MRAWLAISVVVACLAPTTLVAGSHFAVSASAASRSSQSGPTSSATATATAGPAASATATPVISPPPPPPSIKIDKLQLMRNVKGKLGAASTFRVGDSVEILVVYRALHPGKLKPAATLSVLKGRKLLGRAPLRTTRYQQRAAFARLVAFQPSFLGRVVIRVKATLGSASVQKDAALTVQPLAPKMPSFAMPPGWPKILTIPRFGVVASVERIALTQADIHAPFRWEDVAWYRNGPRPGDRGHSVIFGHLDSYCCPAVFWRLADLRKGDLVWTGYRNGQGTTFKVLWQATYPNARVPWRFIFGPAQDRALILVTCAGTFYPDTFDGYDEKRVVYAERIN